MSLQRLGITERPAFDPDDEQCMVRRFFVIRSGFLQHKGSAGGGCTGIAREIDWLYGGGDTRVELEAWNACPSQSAEYIYRLGTKTVPPTVCIFAYSWGCGYGFVQLAEELNRRGIAVHTAVLCDPVYHGLARWRAMMPRGLFSRVWVRVPPNVRRVKWLRQYANKPAGHDLRAEGDYSRIEAPEVLTVPHDQMDNSAVFRQMCLDVAGAVCA